MITFAIAGFLLGIAGSMHCVGMCGPLVMALPTRDISRSRRVVDRVSYNSARVFTYASLGAIVGLGASAFDLVGYGRVLSIIAGAGMIVTAVAQLLWHANLLPTSWIHQRIAPLRNAALAAVQRSPPRAMMLLGMVNGLLPCGLVTSALIGSATGGDVLSGAVFMAAFGMGTAPVMVAVSLGGSELRQRIGPRLGIILPLMALVIGGMVMMRGMALGIPFVSPAHDAQHVHAACCEVE